MNAISYSELREKLASVMEQLVANRETVVITRRGHPDVAMLPADELSSLLETVHVLRSPKNAARFFEALEDSVTGRNLQRVTFEQLLEMAHAPEVTPGGDGKEELVELAKAPAPSAAEAGI